MSMDRYEFIDIELKPILGDFWFDYDIEAIVDTVAEWDGHNVVWKEEWRAEDVNLFDHDHLTEVLLRHDYMRMGDGQTVARVYCWYDYDLDMWRYDLDEVIGYDHVDHIVLPKGFYLFDTEIGKTYAAGESGGAWKVVKNDKGYVLVDDSLEDRRVYGCKTLAENGVMVV